MPIAFTSIILDYLGPFSCDTRDSFHFDAASKQSLLERWFCRYDIDTFVF